MGHPGVRWMPMRLAVLSQVVAAAAAFTAPTFIIPTRRTPSARATPVTAPAMLFRQPKTPPPPPGQGGLEPMQGRTVVTFQPGNVQVYARPGERLGDIANKAGFNVPYGCREGVCGTCEAKMKQPTGQSVDVRVCKDTTPKTNMDCPDRERMWGDLRGGKKSIGELQGPPTEVTIVLQNPTLALKRQRTWEEVKDNIKNNEAKWLDPNYKGTNTVRRNSDGSAKKKGWFS